MDAMHYAMSHALERRRHRNKAYYICSCCDNQFIYNRKKERLCPVCQSRLHFVQTVDEVAEQIIDSYSNNTVVKESEENYNAKILSYRDWFMARTRKESY